MFDISLTTSHDIDTNTLGIRLVSGSERVKQNLDIKLKLWRGEWFLDTEFGTPYLESILGKQLTLSGVLAALRKSILEVKDVRKITSFTYEFNNSTRKLTIEFTADTPFGLVEVTA